MSVKSLMLRSNLHKIQINPCGLVSNQTSWSVLIKQTQESFIHQITAMGQIH